MSQFIIDGQGRLYAVPSYPNYLAHARIKGSKNGYHLFGDRDYTPIGDKAKGPQLQAQGQPQNRLSTVSTNRSTVQPSVSARDTGGSISKGAPGGSIARRNALNAPVYKSGGEKTVLQTVGNSINAGANAIGDYARGAAEGYTYGSKNGNNGAGAGTMYDPYQSEAYNTGREHGRAVGNVANDIKQFVGNSAQAVSDAVSKAFDASVAWVSQAANTVKNAVGSVVDAIVDTAGKVANWATTGFNTAKNWIGGLISGIQTGYSNSREAGRNMSSEITPNPHQASNMAEFQGMQLGNKIGGFAGNAVNTGERAANDARQWINDTANNVSTGIADIKEGYNRGYKYGSEDPRARDLTAPDPYSPANSLGIGLGTYGGMIQRNVNDFFNGYDGTPGLIQNVGNGLNAAGQWIGNAANDVGNAIGTGVNAAGQWIGNAANDVGNAIGAGANAAGQWIGNAANDVGNWATGAYNNVSSQAVQLYNNAVNGFNQALANFRANPTVDNQNALRINQQKLQNLREDILRENVLRENIIR